jgi:holo-[acyl-carrier protein] synthase
LFDDARIGATVVICAESFSVGLVREMIVGIGIDLVEVARIAHAIENPRFLERVLTPKERGAMDKGEASVAGRWAAKEAVYKASGMNLGWQDIEILNGPNGEPICSILPEGRLPGNQRVHVSISHERNLAVAVAIIEQM